MQPTRRTTTTTQLERRVTNHPDRIIIDDPWLTGEMTPEKHEAALKWFRDIALTIPAGTKPIILVSKLYDADEIE